ncbi:MAG: enolase C-terminal domain-like protein [Pirellulales bacterium]
MHVDRIELFHLALPWRRPPETPAGPIERWETVLVAMHSGEAVGWGEAAPGTAPVDNTEWAAGAMAVLRDWLAPRLAGTPIDSGRAIAERLNAFHGHRHAKGALDVAWWDLRARHEGKPLWQALGGDRRQIEVGATLDRMDSPEEFLNTLGGLFEQGYARVRLMFRPGWDLRMIEAVRREYPVETVHLDAEGAMSLEHLDTLCRLDDFDVAMIEQPLPAADLVGHAMVQETIRTPIGLEESITDPWLADVAIELKSGRYMSLRPDRVGGLTAAAAIHDQCRAAAVGCFLGGGRQTTIGVRAGMALASKPGFTYAADFLPSDQWLAEDVAEPLAAAQPENQDTLHVPLWSEPGLGAAPDRELLERWAAEYVDLPSRGRQCDVN